MKLEDCYVGMLVKFGTFKGQIVEIVGKNVTVRYNSWTYKSTWTGEYPVITYTVLDLLEKDDEQDIQ